MSLKDHAILSGKKAKELTTTKFVVFGDGQIRE